MQRKFSEQEIIRREKIAQIKNLGQEAFSSPEKNSDNSKTIFEKYNNLTKQELEESKNSVSVSGRIITTRGPFIVLQDKYNKVQLYVNKKEQTELVKIIELLDIGDIVFAKGYVMKTMTGELAVKISYIKLLTKALKPLPEKFHGLVDVEERFRKRYLDLITSQETRNVFINRTKIISEIRKYFDNLEYLEVDTPVLQPILGGASARPFTTHHNALNMPFYLRIATELPLKKLLVGGLDRVYEIGRIFRNEGVDTTHNPEFTSIEFYEAYSDLEGMMNRTEELIKLIAKKLDKEIIEYQGEIINLKNPFQKINMVSATSEAAGVDLSKISFTEASEVAKKYGIKVEKYFTIGHIINELFEVLIEKTLIQPTFVYGHPIEISPLAQNNAQDSRFTDRAELFINKKEYANMFTELNDPIDQLARFEAQMSEKDAGNAEANEIDMDFVEALEYGMPPAGGCGIGIDRLVMLLTQKESIREVLLFPHLKNKNSDAK